MKEVISQMDSFVSGGAAEDSRRVETAGAYRSRCKLQEMETV